MEFKEFQKLKTNIDRLDTIDKVELLKELLKDLEDKVDTYQKQEIVNLFNNTFLDIYDIEIYLKEAFQKLKSYQVDITSSIEDTHTFMIDNLKEVKENIKIIKEELLLNPLDGRFISLNVSLNQLEKNITALSKSSTYKEDSSFLITCYESLQEVYTSLFGYEYNYKD